MLYNFCVNRSLNLKKRHVTFSVLTSVVQADKVGHGPSVVFFYDVKLFSPVQARPCLTEKNNFKAKKNCGAIRGRCTRMCCLRPTNVHCTA